MDTKSELLKSLPPLVDGKIHGYLTFIVDEVIWSTKSFGEVSVHVSWWGETSKSQFRPAEITKDGIRSQQDTTVVYAIRTNLNLFKEYIKNCETLELEIVSDKTNVILGTSKIGDLLEIFNSKPYFRYVPIITNFGSNIGELHVSMKLERLVKPHNMQLKQLRYNIKREDKNLLPISDTCTNQDDIATDRYNNAYRNIKSDESEIYKSILKCKRAGLKEPVTKCNNEVAERLVAQVVARAQKLRGALLKETCNEDLLPSNYNLTNETTHSNIFFENEAKLDGCPLSNGMPSDETHVSNSLDTDASWSDVASNHLKVSRSSGKGTANKVPSLRTNSVLEDTLLDKEIRSGTEASEVFYPVSYVKISIESLTLSPAGYRRVKSSLLSDNDNVFSSATYFVQYDMMFDCVKKTGKNCAKGDKPVRICSKKHSNEGIYFNHTGTYRLSKEKLEANHSIKFKILMRHHNRKLLIELGSGTFDIYDVFKSEYWKVAKALNIISKGIKVGALSITVEFLLDSRNVLRPSVGRIVSTEESVRMLETEHLLNDTRTQRSKPAMKTQSESSNQVSASLMEGMNCLTAGRHTGTRNLATCTGENIDDGGVDAKSKKLRIADKVSLHGLIYIAEGQELPELNTYLVCRAFWRQDKTTSQICLNTRNPLYQFCQLVPLTYDNNLLERVRNNYIVIEVYSKRNNMDNLLGLTKLSVHHLYMAFKDPNALSNLLSSKYPVVSVDDWVPIINPITGESCGQLLALVALGTSEQIASLEISKGLLHIDVSSPAARLSNFTDYTGPRKDTPGRAYDVQSSTDIYSHRSPRGRGIERAERDRHSSNLESRECQTDISTVKELKFVQESHGVSTFDYSVARDTAKPLAGRLNADKMNIDQSAQTEMNLEEKERDVCCANELNIHVSDDGDNNSVKHSFHLSTETYRSVGVGAEYNEEINQQSNSSHSTATMPSAMNTANESTYSLCNQTTFRAVVEIECALHLPKVETVDGAVEPSTYVSFQSSKYDDSKRENTYTITDIFPRSCNPKWNWRCDAKLPIELLLHDEKRLILKVWRIMDTDVDAQISLERDVVIGFSAIDLTILMNGFPTVSGWFHIMDFTGKCNGQIKVCITPLDNLSLLGRPVTASNSARVPMCFASQSTWLPPNAYVEMQPADIDKHNANYNLPPITGEEEKSEPSENQSHDPEFHIIGFEDVSMSFLSSSLERKLVELNEITQRLQSRLRDVTNAAFEDELENDLDFSEPHSDNENNIDYRLGSSVTPGTLTDPKSRGKAQAKKQSLHNSIENQSVSGENNGQDSLPEMYTNRNDAIGHESVEPDASKMSNSCIDRNLSTDNCETQERTVHSMQDTATGDNRIGFSDYPERGTRTHINYLLDKLCLQFPMQTHSPKVVPVKTQESGFPTNFKQDHVDDIRIYNPDENIERTSANQTDRMGKHNIKPCESSVTNHALNYANEEINAYENRNHAVALVRSPSHKRMSRVIREELIAEENNDATRYDELSTYLVTSNVRHMDVNNIFSPLLYPHLVPDLYNSNTCHEEESVKQLDEQYSKVFSAAITNKLDKVYSAVKSSERGQNVEHSRTTPSGLSENIDDNIDLTALHEARYNDSASNSTESTTTISTEKSLIKFADSKAVEDCDSTQSEKCVLVSSRQAPDGGNPIEDSKKTLVVQQTEDSQYSSSSTTCN